MQLQAQLERAHVPYSSSGDASSPAPMGTGLGDSENSGRPSSQCAESPVCARLLCQYCSLSSYIYSTWTRTAFKHVLRLTQVACRSCTCARCRTLLCIGVFIRHTPRNFACGVVHVLWHWPPPHSPLQHVVPSSAITLNNPPLHPLENGSWILQILNY